jgi:hypothetical protein
VGNQMNGACLNHISQSPFLVGAYDDVKGPLLIKEVSSSSSSPFSYHLNVIIMYRERS